MRMSCTGCRVLRKGCSESCSIRPCLQWIKNPESQANATVFLAKFYGRAGLLNLINAGPDHLRPGIFRSLLYEACGRIVNPIYGSVGLLWSGNWQLCQNAVEAVLGGSPITSITSEVAADNNGPPLKAYDIRHVNKDNDNSTKSNDLHRVRTKCRFKKRSGVKPKVNPVFEEPVHDEEVNRSTSHESSLSHQYEPAVQHKVEFESRDIVNYLHSKEMVEVEDSATCEPGSVHQEDERTGDGEIELELTLGLAPPSGHDKPNRVHYLHDFRLGNVVEGT
ncbi:LOB domain-containing protein 41-like [Lycium ferocissimum]|uniref:LOB domain-containing protein 41-like n=1 Tax=Lycium ferocissimum TaxID=112874 RepID=UPI002816227C|nr:LOB domain-containing protein 41-like [Lycium ferocissimum]